MCRNVYNDITHLEVSTSTKNKNQASKELNIFPLNERTCSLCMKGCNMAKYSFLVEVTFKYFSNI